MPWRYARWLQFYCPRGGAHTDTLAGPLRVLEKRVPLLTASLAVYVTFHLLIPRTKLLNTDEFGDELSPCRNTAYFVWSQNHKIRTVPCLDWPATRPSEVSYSTDVPPHCFAYRFHRTVCYIRAYCFS